MNILAQAAQPGTINNPLLNGSVLNTIQTSTNTSYFIEFFVPKFIGLLFVFGSLAFFFMFIWGAISWILSGGDKAHVENAKGRITNALIGFVLMVTVFAVVAFIETFFDVNILSIDIGPLLIQ
jgi:hypothetical protein